MKNTLLVLVSFCMIAPQLATAQTHTEIYIFDCKIWHDQFSLSNPRNVTSNPGFYDNQPYFLPDGDTFMFSSADESGKTDIYMYDLRSRSKRRLTYTPEDSEYSPTPTLDKKGFSCIILEEDGTQKLWKYFTNAPIASLVTDIDKVGYHTWYDENNLGLFILGEDNDPNYLVVTDIESGEKQKIAESVGSGLFRIPNQEKISFSKLNNSDQWTIMSLNMESMTTELITQMVSNKSQNYTWTSDGILLMGDGTKLYKFDPTVDKEWVELADLSKYGLGNFTRIAVNPQASKLAVVVDE